MAWSEDGGSIRDAYRWLRYGRGSAYGIRFSSHTRNIVKLRVVIRVETCNDRKEILV